MHQTDICWGLYKVELTILVAIGSCQPHHNVVTQQPSFHPWSPEFPTPATEVKMLRNVTWHNRQKLESHVFGLKFWICIVLVIRTRGSSLWVCFLICKTAPWLMVVLKSWMKIADIGKVYDIGPLSLLCETGSNIDSYADSVVLECLPHPIPYRFTGE